MSDSVDAMLMVLDVVREKDLRAHLKTLLHREPEEREVDLVREMCARTPFSESSIAQAYANVRAGCSIGFKWIEKACLGPLRPGELCISMGPGHGRTQARIQADNVMRALSADYTKTGGDVTLSVGGEPVGKIYGQRPYRLRFDEIDDLMLDAKEVYPELREMQPWLPEGHYVWRDMPKLEGDRFCNAHHKFVVPDRLSPWLLGHAFHFETRTPWGITKWSLKYPSHADESLIFATQNGSTSTYPKSLTASQICADILDRHGVSIQWPSIPSWSIVWLPRSSPMPEWKP